MSFESNPLLDNSSDITVNRSALPSNWSPTDLRTGINIITEQMYRKGALAKTC
jgi:hypothetical protein